MLYARMANAMATIADAMVMTTNRWVICGLLQPDIRKW
jgi:hypothetical protein